MDVRSSPPKPQGSSLEPRSRFLDLPYDVRYLVFKQLFPPLGSQIYLSAYNKRLRSITPNAEIPLQLLLTCRQLLLEGSEYLYSTYLFNIIGRKLDCVDSYESFARTVQKYARGQVHVESFSNGEHSATMCISVHAGEGKLDAVEQRQRGVRVSILDIREELAKDLRNIQLDVAVRFENRRRVVPPCLKSLFMAVVAIVAVIVAWAISNAHS